ncbi:extracellular solute-binding protein [Paenibacillus sp. NEAU-GSW1]|uniref:extracellular solute-binding protein n=1 Tax=Paenibacillus sp. NEAU-GSW1 TaxID=2682486 RepID=UPI0012E13E97|nr:extracellular solute-binding protein [Paenibacillus sp. NEAU-GSW1]MUT67017.1 extracellular solute-binding protein [Paenibacillus sp. NEAU-GSW1]
MLNRNRRKPFIVTTVCLLLVGLTACKSEQAAPVKTRDPADLPLETPITIRVPYAYQDIELPEGDVGDDQFLNRYIKEQTGVTIKYSWEASGEEQYVSRLNLAIQSDDLPDAFIVNREQFRQLVKMDKLEDLTDYYTKNTSQLVKKFYDATDGNALREASFDGRLYGLPNVAIEADAPTYLWVRQDWLDKLHLKPPSTIDDIEHIAKQFNEQDPDGNGKADTVGIPVNKEMLFGEKTGVGGLDGVFNSYHAFPKSWIYDAQGQVVYGSTQPEAKMALAKLAMWYKEGVIDEQFVLRKEYFELIDTNRSGILFGPWWTPYWPLSSSVANDTKAEWRVYMAPVDKSGTFVTKTAPITDHYLVIRKGYPHPEAAIKVLNLLTRLERNQEPNQSEVKQLRTTADSMSLQLRNYYPFDLLLDYPDAIEKRYDQLLLAVNGSLNAESLDTETKSLYDSMMLEMEQPRKSIEAWSSSQAYLYGGEVSKATKVQTKSLFYDTTQSMEKYWDELQQLEYDTYLRIITGELPIEAFDAFVQEWESRGGSIIAKEVSEAVTTGNNS